MQSTNNQFTIDLKQVKGKAAAPAPGEPRPIGADPAATPAPVVKKDDGDTASGIDRALAEGNVIIVQDKPDARNTSAGGLPLKGVDIVVRGAYMELVQYVSDAEKALPGLRCRGRRETGQPEKIRRAC